MHLTTNNTILHCQGWTFAVTLLFQILNNTAFQRSYQLIQNINTYNYRQFPKIQRYLKHCNDIKKWTKNSATYCKNHRKHRCIKTRAFIWIQTHHSKEKSFRNRSNDSCLDVNSLHIKSDEQTLSRQMRDTCTPQFFRKKVIIFSHCILQFCYKLSFIFSFGAFVIFQPSFCLTLEKQFPHFNTQFNFAQYKNIYLLSYRNILLYVPCLPTHARGQCSNVCVRVCVCVF